MITTYMQDIFRDLCLELNYILKVGHHYELFMFLKAFDAVIHHGCIKLVKKIHKFLNRELILNSIFDQRNAALVSMRHLLKFWPQKSLNLLCIEEIYNVSNDCFKIIAVFKVTF